MATSIRLSVSASLQWYASWWLTPSEPSRPRVTRMRTRRKPWTRRAARKPLRSRTPPNEGKALRVFARSHCCLLLTPEGRLYELVRSALPAGDFIAVPGSSRLLPQLRMTAGCGMLDDAEPTHLF